MANIFIHSDPHFGHANILKFTREDGTRLRNFSSVEEMDEHMVERWNATVKANDHAYILGDIAMKQSGLQILSRLNGHLRLVRGNHDIFKTKTYLKYFDEIYGVRILDDMIFSHIPLHTDSIKTRWHGNVHGHLHNNHDAFHLGPRYFNASVEMINYTPIALEEVKKHLVEGTRPNVK